jgi:ribosome recycling factor
MPVTGRHHGGTLADTELHDTAFRDDFDGDAMQCSPSTRQRRVHADTGNVPPRGRCEGAAILRRYRKSAETSMLANIKQDAQTRMTKSIEALRQELQRLRTGRASTALVEHLKVNYYGSDVPIGQVANIAVADARSLMITPWEKNMVQAVEKAILASDLGLTPTTAGTVIRLNMPALTAERRKELAKHVAHEGENAKIAIRNIRRDALHQVKELLKDKTITEDEERRAEDEMQKLTDKSIKDVDAVVKTKEDELMAL